MPRYRPTATPIRPANRVDHVFRSYDGLDCSHDAEVCPANGDHALLGGYL